MAFLRPSTIVERRWRGSTQERSCRPAWEADVTIHRLLRRKRWHGYPGWHLNVPVLKVKVDVGTGGELFAPRGEEDVSFHHVEVWVQLLWLDARWRRNTERPALPRP